MIDAQDEVMDDEKRYKRFKEEQLSRVKVTAHLRKTSRWAIGGW